MIKEEETVNRDAFHDLPFLLYADGKGRMFEHPYLRMAGFSGSRPVALSREDLMVVPEFSKLFYLPHCPPIGLDPETGKWETLMDMEVDGRVEPCCGVAVFLEPGLVRTHLPAVDYGRKSYVLPMWAYTAVGSRDGQYWAAGFQVESNPKWDPRNYDDRRLLPAIRRYERTCRPGPLLAHLRNCATQNHCFAAKNLFLQRWEAPLPVSRTCNAACLGCLSFQPRASCEASHGRLSFVPSKEEIVFLAVQHLETAPEAIVSFGQGCEGEPLTQYRLIAQSIREIRKRTSKGTINLNTNGSQPSRVRLICESGLDSIRISLNSPRRDLYHAYYRPKNYGFEDVAASIGLARGQGLYTMINYLVFPGVSDQEEEMEAMERLVNQTGVQFIHLKNLCIDPEVYLANLPVSDDRVMGMRTMAASLKSRFPDIHLGYFNQPVPKSGGAFPIKRGTVAGAPSSS